MSALKLIWKIVNNGWSVVTMMAAAGLGLYWHDFWKDLNSSPWWVLLLVSLAVVTLVAFLIKHGRSFWERWKRETKTPAPISATMVHSAGQSGGSINVERSSIVFGNPDYQSVKPLRRKRLSTAALQDLKDRLLETSGALFALLHETAYVSPPIESGTFDWAANMQENRARGNERQKRYDDDFKALVFALIQEAHVCGYKDERLQQWAGPHVTGPIEEIATRLGALAYQIKPEEQGSDRGNWIQRLFRRI